jgi:hypothetical protein
MNRYIFPIALVVLLAVTSVTRSQNLVPSFIYPQTSALPPGNIAAAPSSDPNGRRWMLLEGYGGNGRLYQQWQLVNPEDLSAKGYRGFHTATD